MNGSKPIKLCLALSTIMMALAACDGTRQPLLADQPVTLPPVTVTGEAPPPLEDQTPAPGARPPVSGQSGPVPAVAVYNSDNRPIVTRTGLNSDPNNPSGAPGRPQAWYE